MENLTWNEAIRPSRSFTLLLLVLHLGSASVVHLSNMPWMVKMMLFALTASSLVYYLMRDVGLRLPFSWREISLNQRDVAVITQNGTKLAGLLLNTSVVFGYFVILLVRLEGRYFTTTRIIFRDSINPEMFRRLCVHLKFVK